MPKPLASQTDDRAGLLLYLSRPVILAPKEGFRP
jgi:hypothetical protein